jgi:hypothetical protein
MTIPKEDERTPGPTIVVREAIDERERDWLEDGNRYFDEEEWGEDVPHSSTERRLVVEVDGERSMLLVDSPGAFGETADNIAVFIVQAVNAYTSTEALRSALAEELVWHEAAEKALSKQPQSGDIGWRRSEHQERIEAIRAALTASAAPSTEGLMTPFDDRRFVVINGPDAGCVSIVTGINALVDEVKSILWAGDDEPPEDVLRILDVVGNPDADEWHEHDNSPPHLMHQFEDGWIAIWLVTEGAARTALAGVTDPQTDIAKR